MSKCFGVRIILQDKNDPVAEDTDFGLYNVPDDNSEFRWIQNDIDGLGWTWKAGMIINGGLKPFSIEIDLSRGGNISYPGSGGVTIQNLTKFHELLSGRGIVITGLKLEIWELGSDAFWNKIRTYFCQEPSYDIKEYTITFKGGQERRVANILNVVTTEQYQNSDSSTIGKVIPASFGKLIPLFNDTTMKISRSSAAKFARSINKIEERYYSDDFFTGSGYTKIVTFPIIDIYSESELIYKCALRGTGSGILTTTDTYVRITEGTGKDQIRKINGFSWASNYIIFSIQDFFQTELSDDDESEEGRSWVQFIKIYRRFDSDHWPCGGFVDTNGTSVEQPEMYTINDNNLERIPKYGYNKITTNEAENQLAIDPKMFDQGNIDDFNSYLILPIENLHLAADADLSNWEGGNGHGTGWWTGIEKHESFDGVYSSDMLGDVLDSYLSDPSYATDKIRTTYALSHVNGVYQSGGNHYYKVLYFDLPSLPDDFTFSKLYIGLHMYSESDGGDTGNDGGNDETLVMLRRFSHGIKTMKLKINEITGANAIDVPDFYCIDGIETNNEYFYMTNENPLGQSGYLNPVFDTGITNRDEYETYIQGAMTFLRMPETGIWTDETKFYEICFIFKNESSVSDSIFAVFEGRKFSESWREGFDPADVIEKPFHLLEHVCRLQNYQDVCPTPISGWGLQYAANPLINAGASFGSFEDPALLNTRDMCLAAQVYESGEGFTDKLKQSICSEFAFANWQDAGGNECILALPEEKLHPVHTVTFDDIVDRSAINIRSLSQERIYIEPFVRYDYNPATDKYESLLRITNTMASTYNSNYISGFRSEIDGLLIWNACHSLAIRCNKTNKTPADISDLKFANGDQSYTIAYNYLNRFVNWQFCEEIELKTHCNIALSWQECTPFNVLFSHQTNNVSRSCLTEKTTVNPNHPYDVAIKAIMYA